MTHLRLLALSLDLDGPLEYAALHDVKIPQADPHMMYGGPLTRFIELCEETGASAGTLFAIGRDLWGVGAEALGRACGLGFEVGCHSFSHDYRFTRGSALAIEDDLGRAREVWIKHLGKAPVGFRAPGYHLSVALLDALESNGFAYDSSVMPSLPYYGAKLGVLMAYRVLGRRSAALLGNPSLALAPGQPYRPGRKPYRRGQRRLWELPIAVATPLGLPVTGAALVMAPDLLRRALVRALDRKAILILNIHAMDLVEPEADQLPALLYRHQPELRIPWLQRRAILKEVIASLALDRQVVTLRQATAALSL